MTHASPSKCYEWQASTECCNISLVKMRRGPGLMSSEADEYQGMTVYPSMGLLGHMVVVFNFLRNICTVSHNGYANLHSHQQCTGQKVLLFFSEQRL